MPSTVDEHVETMRDVRALTERALAAALSHVDETTSYTEVRALVLDSVAAVVQQYGEVAGTVGADLFDELRAEAGARGRWRAELPPGWTDRQIRSELVGAISKYRKEEFTSDALYSSLRNPVDKLVLGQGRRAIAFNVSKDRRGGPAWAKVPVGKTCAWCLMIASRGPVFYSERSANKTFHGHCDCVAWPMWDGSKYPPGYDVDGLYAGYRHAADAVSGKATPKKILAEMRSQLGVK